MLAVRCRTWANSNQLANSGLSNSAHDEGSLLGGQLFNLFLFLNYSPFPNKMWEELSSGVIQLVQSTLGSHCSATVTYSD